MSIWTKEDKIAILCVGQMIISISEGNMAKKEQRPKEKAEITPADKPVFFWQAVEFESQKKGASWFAYIVVAALAVIGVFIWQKQWLGIGVVIAAVAALWSQSRTSGKKKNYAIYDQGVTIDNRVYTFDQFKSFWIFLYQERVIIRFEQLRRLALPVEMPIEGESPDQIRLLLSKHLPEEEGKGEDILDKVNRWIRF